MKRTLLTHVVLEAAREKEWRDIINDFHYLNCVFGNIEFAERRIYPRINPRPLVIDLDDIPEIPF